MTDLQFRPRFKFRTPMHPDEIRDRLRAQVRDHNPAGYRLAGNLPHMILLFAPEQRRLWTPQMSLDLELEQAPGQETFTVVRCLIGPAPTVWMAFMGGYVAVAVLGLLGLSIGIPQHMLGESPWGLYATGPLLAVAVLLWVLAQLGKQRAKDDMVALKRFVDGALGCDCLRLADAQR